MDITRASNGKIQTHAGYYEIPIGRKREPRTPIKETDSDIEIGMDNKA